MPRIEGAQEGRLAGLGAADHDDVATGGGEVDEPGVLPLLRGVVEQADRDAQAVGAAEAQAVRGGLDAARGAIECDRVRQRWQPQRPGGFAGDAGDGGGQRGWAGGARAGLAFLGHLDGDRCEHRCGHRALPNGSRRFQALRRPGDVRGLEARVDRRVDLQVAEARQRRQVEGVGGVEDGAALGLGERAQTEPVGQVGLEAGAACRASRRWLASSRCTPMRAADAADGRGTGR